MLQSRILLFGLSFLIFKSIHPMEEGDDYLQKVKTKIIKQKKKDKATETKNFFDQIKSEAESQSQFLTTPTQIETNQDFVNLIQENEEALQKATPEEQVVINGLMQHYFSEIEQSEAMAEVLTQIAKGVFKGIVNKCDKLRSHEGQKEFLLGNITAVANIVKGTFYLGYEGISYLLLTPEQKKLKKEAFYNSIQSIKNNCTNISPDDCFESIGEIIVDTLMLKGLTKIANAYTVKFKDAWNLSTATKIGRRTVNTGDMIEDLYEKGHRTIRNADKLPPDQLPTLNKKLKGLPKDKKELKALLVEDKQIARKHMEEVIVAKAAESQGALKGPITRPQQTSGGTSRIDFHTAGKKFEKIDVKSVRADYHNPKIFDKSRFINEIKDEIARGETILLNMAHLNKEHLLSFMEGIVQGIDAQDRFNKIILSTRHFYKII